ncbi:MAG: recombination mediator RecR [Elusimicrobiota bacterium]|nr:recombination mediator RecR [Elusimicrobiota bacterium]
MSISEKLKKLAELINKLPGIGPKMSERLAYHIFQMNVSEVRELIDAIESVKKLNLCSECFLPTEDKLCKICSDASRDRTVICVVKNVSSVNAIERTGKFSGVYLVLDKILSPLDGTSPEKARIKKLLERISAGGIKEVIIATDTDTEGELTANYIAQAIKMDGLKITRLGYGMPVGGSLEYADEITLSRSLEGRKEI